MAIERAAGESSSVIDVLDRVLDKGIVIDAWVRLSLVGIDLVTVEARVVVASIATYLQFTEAGGSSVVFGGAPAPSPPRSTVPNRSSATLRLLLPGGVPPNGDRSSSLRLVTRATRE